MVAEGFKAEHIAPAVALMVGVYSMFVGFFKLGFLLEYISTPVLSGFISAAATVIILGQLPSIFGLDNVRSGTANTIHDFFATLGQSDWRTVLIGFSGIFILQSLQFVSRKYGKKSKIIWALSIGRAAIVLLIFTSISYGVNKNRPQKPLFEISKIKSAGIRAPQIPPAALISKVAVRALAPFLAASLEHIGIAKAFALKNNYRIDTSQELSYLGITNFFNSWFGAMPVGGAMSRSAVNSDTGVKSPLNGIFTSAFVILGIYKLSGALFWIPKATLAAIIITAVWHLVGPANIFYRYWRTSFADFVASMLCFWVTLFLSSEEGIAFGVGFSIVWTMLRAAFSGVTNVTMDSKMEEGKRVSVFGEGKDDFSLREVGEDTKVFRFQDSILFPNAERVKDQILDVLQVYHSGVDQQVDTEQQKERNWSVARENRVKRLRKRAQVGSHPPQLSIVVLDFAKVSMIDSTGLNSLSSLRSEIARFAGNQCEIRCVNVDWSVWHRFERYGWTVKTELDHSHTSSSSVVENNDTTQADIVIFESLARAIGVRSRRTWYSESIQEVASEKV
jgi:sodium-independent sulfate anion transporter 11